MFSAFQFSESVKFRSGRLAYSRDRLGATNCRSALKKKCTLSWMIGPPMTPPNSFLLVAGFSSVALFLTK